MRIYTRSIGALHPKTTGVLKAAPKIARRLRRIALAAIAEAGDGMKYIAHKPEEYDTKIMFDRVPDFGADDGLQADSIGDGGGDS